jgi:hypothetical protein
LAAFTPDGRICGLPSGIWSKRQAPCQNVIAFQPVYLTVVTESLKRLHLQKTRMNLDQPHGTTIQYQTAAVKRILFAMKKQGVLSPTPRL